MATDSYHFQQLGNFEIEVNLEVEATGHRARLLLLPGPGSIEPDRPVVDISMTYLGVRRLVYALQDFLDNHSEPS